MPTLRRNTHLEAAKEEVKAKGLAEGRAHQTSVF